MKGQTAIREIFEKLKYRDIDIRVALSLAKESFEARALNRVIGVFQQADDIAAASRPLQIPSRAQQDTEGATLPICKKRSPFLVLVDPKAGRRVDGKPPGYSGDQSGATAWNDTKMVPSLVRHAWRQFEFNMVHRPRSDGAVEPR
jgi:hypothetical protein